MSKSTAQQIADLQNKLQALRTKKARQDRREETRQKIILGAEVAKVLDKKPEEINKALILGLLSKINELDEEEKQEFSVRIILNHIKPCTCPLYLSFHLMAILRNILRPTLKR